MRKKNKYIEDRKTLRKYYCKICHKKISIASALYGSKLCQSCACKKRYKNPENHPMFGRKGKTCPRYNEERHKKYYCIKCGEEICYINWKYGSGKCMPCSQKGKNLSDKHKQRIGKAHIGMKQSEKTKEKMSKILSDGRRKGKNCYWYGKTTPHGKHIKYKNIWMRSSWEVKFAFFLDCSGIKWLYEPKRFYFKNCSYLPDFYIPEWNLYIEIKGWFTKKGKKRFNLFKKKNPKLNIKLLIYKDLKELGIL